MTSSRSIEFIFCFSYVHYATDGKLQNVLDFLDASETEIACLNLLNPTFEGMLTETEEIGDRLHRVHKAIKTLSKQGIDTHLILPGRKTGKEGSADQRYWRDLYEGAAQAKAKRIWVSDLGSGAKDCTGYEESLKHFRFIRRCVHKVNPSMPIGLLAANPYDYIHAGWTGAEAAGVLGGDHRAVLAQSQGFESDSLRTEILHVVPSLTASVGAEAEVLGYIDNRPTGGYHKSTEAMQMQINLNVLHGISRMLINCFDDVGTAPGTDNLYLQMLDKSSRFLRQLAKRLPATSRPDGVRVLTVSKKAAGKIGSSNSEVMTDWPEVLLRLGIPVRVEPAKSVKIEGESVYVLPGVAAAELGDHQLRHVFRNGVLLDAPAAKILQQKGYDKLTGAGVGGRLQHVDAEILSDQSFACPYYGYRTAWRDTEQSEHFYRIRTKHREARPVTTLLAGKGIPNQTGMVLFDDMQHHRRSGVLPFGGCLYEGGGRSCMLLAHERQRHFHDILCWLKRGRLSCFVENTPDLIPFYIPVEGKRRILLALLNIGFDWAIHARIRLGKTGFKVKRVRSLEEDGQMSSFGRLQVVRHRDYEYIQLTSETSVPPMQMTVLVLEG